MKIIFNTYRALNWDTSRRQPSIFLSDENEKPFSVPSIYGSKVIGDTREKEMVHLHARWPVDGFGEVTLLTGLLEPAEKAYNLNVEIAKNRIQRVLEKENEWRKKGFKTSPEYKAEMQKAQNIFSYIKNEDDEDVKARWADLSLSVSVPAGEMLALEYAEWGMEKRRSEGTFKGFRWGTFAVENYKYNEKETEYFKKFFNFASIPCDWGIVEKVEGEIDWASMDILMDWLLEKGIEVKAQPLFWLLDRFVPDWLDLYDLPNLKKLTRERILKIVGKYKDKIRFWDSINEMNSLNLYGNMQTSVDLSKICVDAVKEADSSAVCAVNTNEPFGEYNALRNDVIPHYGSRAIDYLQMLVDQDVEFDVAEVQVYHGAGFSYCRDLFEMSRHFDLFEKLNKPVILSELGCPSDEGVDVRDMYVDMYGSEEQAKDVSQRWKASEAGSWHGPWTQTTQADWYEGFSKVLMGKEFITGIVFFDFTDRIPHFYTHAGILDIEGKPKESYHRLLALKEKYIDQQT